MNIKQHNKTIPAKRFQNLLLAWFDENGRKNLPWQIAKTPYKVWISEIMLQQTQVVSVMTYFCRFMHEFPHISELASANEDKVLHLWAGLGYYSRAHNLHRTSKIIVNEYAGKFPDQIDQLIKLPGIGLSTASAILSLAFDKPATILDGNVKRVLARLHGINQPINQSKIIESLWEIALSYTPKQRCADYTQAIMDLGATVCTPRKPKCHLCPYTKYCLAYKEELTEIIPVKSSKAKVPVKHATFIILKTNDTVLLEKRPHSGIWRGLWSLPELSGEPDFKTIEDFCKTKLNHEVKDYVLLDSFIHTFTHFRLTIHPILIRKSYFLGKMMEGNGQIWYKLSKPQNVGLPKPILKILETLR